MGNDNISFDLLFGTFLVRLVGHGFWPEFSFLSFEFASPNLVQRGKQTGGGGRLIAKKEKARVFEHPFYSFASSLSTNRINTLFTSNVMSYSRYSMEALALTYRKIKELYGNVDSYNVVKEVDKYRNYWRPDKVNVILLAESHVYTSDEDFKIEMNYSGFEKLNSAYPRRFVRFVYCIGYSEPELYADKPLNPSFKNPGTWQFWKIFCACASESEEIECGAVLKGTTKNLIERINNKIDLLNKLRAKGIWLVDSSIAGINRLSRNQREKIILISWNNYVKHLVEESKPKIIIYIGKTVWDALEIKIKETNIPRDYVNQPQAHLTSQEREKEHEKLQKLCSKYCNVS